MENFAIISWQIAKQALKKAGWIGSKDVELTDVQNEDIVQYDASLDKFINSELRTKAKVWRPNHVYEQYEIVVWDSVLYWVLQNHTSHTSEIEVDVADNKIMPFAKELGLSNVLLLEGVISNKGETLTITWNNPASETFEKSIGYISDTVDITTMRRDEILPLVGTSVTEFYNGGTVDTQSSTTLTVASRTHQYIKVFVEHLIDIETKYSGGRYTVIDNPDIYPPETPTGLSVTLAQGRYANIAWTNPTDADLFKIKVVRGVGDINVPTDGAVIATFGTDTMSMIDYAVQPLTVYNYAVFAYDDAGNGYQTGVEGNWSKSATVQFSFVPVHGFDITTGQRINGEGLVQEDFNDMFPWNAMRRAVANVDGTINYYLNPTNSTQKIDGSPAVLDGTDGEVVVEKPAFYYKIENGQILISQETFTGAILSPRTLIGFAPATEIGGKLRSVTGAMPLTNKAIEEFRNMCLAGWQMLDHETLLAIRALFLVEYGAYNSQTLIGRGIVDATAAVPSGDTLILGNASGANGSVSYRGIENLWGNQFQLLDGVVATDTSYYVATSGFDTFVDDDTKGTYVAVGGTPITTHGFISELNDAFLAVAVNGDSGTFVGDHQYGHTAGQQNVCAIGGRYDEGDKAGLFRNHFGLNRVDTTKAMDVLWEEIGLTGTEQKVYSSSDVQLVQEGVWEIVLPRQWDSDLISIVGIEI